MEAVRLAMRPPSRKERKIFPMANKPKTLHLEMDFDEAMRRAVRVKVPRKTKAVSLKARPKNTSGK